ncbi:MAG: isochorismatase family protein [Sedimentisphaerales bacterium]|nr:isochorismatase family protein [Sedimentisphaerales bacterium]
MNSTKCGLVIIDVQGKLAQLMHEKERLFAHIEVLIRMAKTLEIPILWCQQVPQALGPTVESIAGLMDGVEPIDKSSFSACGDPGFRQRWKSLGRPQAILCGIEAHVCVCQTACDLLEGGHEVAVVADAVSSRTAENKRIALDRMAAEGAMIYSVEMLLFELLGDAKHDQFRELARLIK